MKIHKIKKKKKKSYAPHLNNKILHIYVQLRKGRSVLWEASCQSFRNIGSESWSLSECVDRCFFVCFFNKVFFWTIGCSSYSSLGWSLPPPLLLLPPPPPTGPGWEDVVRRWLPESPICSEVDTTERGGVQPELSRGFLLPPPSSAGPREVKGQLVRVKLLLRLPVVLV